MTIRAIPRVLHSIGLSCLLAACAGCRPAEPRHQGAAPPSADERFVDELAIRALIERASDAINHHEWTRVEGMLTEDIVWEALPPIGWKLEGVQAVRRFFAKNEPIVEVLSYNVLASNVELQGPERATARSTMIELLHLKEKGVGLQIVGSYTDHFAKRDGVWKFSRRTFALRYETDVPLPQRRDGTSNVPASAK